MDPVAEEVLGLLGSGRQAEPFSARDPGFDLPRAYRAAAALRQARMAAGDRPVGRKIGFTNRTIWDEYGVHAPIWGDVLGSTLHDLADLPGEIPAFDLAGLAEPRIEPEIAFADLADNADLAESFLKGIFETLLSERPDDMGFFRDRIDKGCIDRLEQFVNASFERMEYTDAITALEGAVAGGHKFEYPVSWGIDLQSEHERWLTEEHVGRPIVVMNYPKDIKAFYMRLNDDERTVAAMDVLAPGIGEIIGGAQREDRLDVLDRRIGEMGLEAEDYWWYRDLRRYGTVPHAGFGLGFERTMAYATGMANVRDLIPFPRTPNTATF